MASQNLGKNPPSRNAEESFEEVPHPDPEEGNLQNLSSRCPPV